MQHTVLETGANGYIGSHLIRFLCDYDKAYKVIAVDRHSTNVDCRAIFVECDIFRAVCGREMYASLHNPDICVHLAWQDGFDHNSEKHLENFFFHSRFIRTLTEAEAKHITVAGSFREYGSIDGQTDERKIVIPSNYYSLAKTALKDALEILFKNTDVCFQWIRPFTVYGDDQMNNSILSKILIWEQEGKTSFPFTDGKEEYDYIHVNEVAKQISAIISQREVDGIIDCCSGKPMKLKDMVEQFISERQLKIRPEYGVFKTRDCDSKVIYGNPDKINKIMARSKLV
jgi:dTDP-6-deoxy-L-talose 4-dehydrogenase (NAD+)